MRHSGLSNSLTVYTDSVTESSHFFLLFVADLADFFVAALAGFLAFALAGLASAVEVTSASALGFGSRLGGCAAVFEGLAPPVRISVIGTTENPSPYPRLPREFS